MPTVDVVVNSDMQLSIRARQVCGMFDCPPEKKQVRRWNADLSLEDKPWNVGLIVGPSGSGKSTCARALWPRELSYVPTWDSRSIVDNFPVSNTVEQIASALNSVGFSTIPAWLRPYGVLSTGEQFRADIARRLIEQTGLIVIDEFTSVVDRQVAKVACNSVQKFVRKEKRQLVAVTCHHDVIEWLQPDWLFEPGIGQFNWRCLQRRPEIDIEVARLPYAAWKIFAPYHYLTSELHRAATCFGLWADGTLASFAGVIHKVHPKTKSIKGISRVVTLPDWQGLGLAFVLMETLGQAYSAQGMRLRIYPAHPHFVRQFRSNMWRCDRKPGKHMSLSGNTAKSKRWRETAKQRPCAVFEYIGPSMDKITSYKLLRSL